MDFPRHLNYSTPTFSGTVTGRGVSSGKYLANAIECTYRLPDLDQPVPDL